MDNNPWSVGSDETPTLLPCAVSIHRLILESCGRSSWLGRDESGSSEVLPAAFSNS